MREIYFLATIPIASAVYLCPYAAVAAAAADTPKHARSAVFCTNSEFSLSTCHFSISSGNCDRSKQCDQLTRGHFHRFRFKRADNSQRILSDCKLADKHRNTLLSGCSENSVKALLYRHKTVIHTVAQRAACKRVQVDIESKREEAKPFDSFNIRASALFFLSETRSSRTHVRFKTVAAREGFLIPVCLCSHPHVGSDSAHAVSFFFCARGDFING